MPKIFDMCVLYKRNAILKRMVDNLFNVQRKYAADFEASVHDMVQGMASIRRKLEDMFELSASDRAGAAAAAAAPNRRDESHAAVQARHQKLKAHFKDIFELVYYLTDMFITLNAFVRVETKLTQQLLDQRFELHLRSLVETCVFSIESELDEFRVEHRDAESRSSTSLIKSQLKRLKFEAAKLFNKIVVNCFINPAVQNVQGDEEASPSSKKDLFCGQQFVRVCTDTLDDVHFLCYYERKFALSEQVELVYQLCNGEM